MVIDGYRNALEFIALLDFDGELPDNWNDVKDISSFRSRDRSFVFPGEQVHILACLSPSKQDTEIMTPFKLAAAMSKNGNATDEGKSLPVSEEMELDSSIDPKDGMAPTPTVEDN